MQYSLTEVLTLTIFSMTAVFLVLLGLMALMLLSAKIFGGKETSPPPPPPVAVALTDQALFEADPLAKVAAMVALAQASEENDGKTFKIKQIKKID